MQLTELPFLMREGCPILCHCPIILLFVGDALGGILASYPTPGSREGAENWQALCCSALREWPHREPLKHHKADMVLLEKCISFC